MTKYIFSKGVVSIDPSVYAAVEDPATKETSWGVLILAPRNYPQEVENTNNPACDKQEKVEVIDTTIKPNSQPV